MQLFEKDELRLLWPFYMDYLLSQILFFAPAFYIVYFLDIGLTLFQLGLVMAAAPLAGLLFEIPTGAVADLYGRKFSVLLSFVLVALGYLLLFFFTGVPALIAIFALIGFAATFWSGAKDAWVVDLIGKRTSLLHNYFAKADFLSSAGLVLSGILGAFVVDAMGLRSIWLFAAGAYMISFFVLLIAPEQYRRRQTTFVRVLKNMKQQTKNALQYCRMHHILYAFFIASALWLIAGAIGGVMAWTPFLIDLGFAEQNFGYLWSAMAVVQMIGLAISQFALSTISSRKVIIVALSLFAASLIAVYWVTSLPYALALVILSVLFASAKAPSLSVFFHRFTPSYMRATIGSVKATLGAAIGIVMLPISGHFIDAIGAQHALFSAGLALIPAVGIYLLMKEH